MSYLMEVCSDEVSDEVVPKRCLIAPKIYQKDECSENISDVKVLQKDVQASSQRTKDALTLHIRIIRRVCKTNKITMDI